MIARFAIACQLMCSVAAAQTEQATEFDPFRFAEPVRTFAFGINEDRDFDRLPDDWTRRRGRGFPSYVKARIDRETEPSLRIDVDGGAVAMYSPVLPADAHHAYLLRGRIRTRLLKNDAALISLSFLDASRNRIGRRLTKPVTGTHRGLVNVRIATSPAPPQTRFVVVGCHLVVGEEPDLKGAVWFDDIHVARLPRLGLVSNYHTHFIRPSADVKIVCTVSGLQTSLPNEARLVLSILSRARLLALDRTFEQPPANHVLSIGVANRRGTQVAKQTFPLQDDASRTIRWSLPPQPYGYYNVTAKLLRIQSDSRQLVLQQSTSLVVLDLVEQPSPGDFGWMMPEGARRMSLNELPDVAKQGGVNLLAWPLWKQVGTNNNTRTRRHTDSSIGRLFSALGKRKITPVGMLNSPPPELRSRFPADWRGIAEVFALPAKIWMPHLETVLARYSVAVRHWILGDDSSFHALDRPGKVMGAVKREFDRIGRDTLIGVPWKNLKNPPQDLPLRSVAVIDLGTKSPNEVALPKKANVWFVLKPLSASSHSLDARAADLVRRMVTAKIAGAKAVFLRDLHDARHGILRPDGAPNLLFLPWRTTALALRNTEYLGTWDLPSGIENRLFLRKDEAVLVLWNSSTKETQTETLVVGPRAEVIDVWGGRPKREFDPERGTLKVTVGRLPVFVRFADPHLARFRSALRFKDGRMKSQYGMQAVTLLGKNTFTQGMSGTVTVTLPKEWRLSESRFTLSLGSSEEFRIPLGISLPLGVDLGRHWAKLEFAITSDQLHQFTEWRALHVGVGDLHLVAKASRLPDGRLEIKQTLTNNTSPAEKMSFRCTLFVPGQPRQQQIVVKLGSGKDTKHYFLPDDPKLRGQKLWIRAEQLGGPRVLNYRFLVPVAEE